MSLAVLLAAALAVVAYLLTTPKVQQLVLERATQALSDKFGTAVKVKHAEVSLTGVSLYGIAMNDHQDTTLLAVDTLRADIDMWRLLKEQDAHITEVSVRGLDLNAYKLYPDTVANYQFALDSLKSKRKTEAERPKQDDGWLKARLKRLLKERIHVDFNLDEVQLTRTHLHYRLDNGKPKKNVGKPHRGEFDAGHLDLECMLKATARVSIKQKTGEGTLLLTGVDEREAGIHVDTLTCRFHAKKGGVQLDDMLLRLHRTYLKIPHATLSGLGGDFHFTTSTIKGQCWLPEIARPFAPVLKKFTLPLNLSVRLEGSFPKKDSTQVIVRDTMLFRDINISSPDKRLVLKAQGGMYDVRRKHDMHLAFRIKSLTARRGVKEQIIKYFNGKPKMLAQLKKTGDLYFTGRLSLPYKQEHIAGTARFSAGTMTLDVTIDNTPRRIYGTATTKGLDLSKVFKAEELGPVAGTACFSFDYSSKRKARQLGLRPTKLPKGKVWVELDQASYHVTQSLGVLGKMGATLHADGVTATITSDGFRCEGDVLLPKDLYDVTCHLWYDTSEDKPKLHFKPKLTLHKGAVKEMVKMAGNAIAKGATVAAKATAKGAVVAAQATAKGATVAAKATGNAVSKAAKAVFGIFKKKKKTVEEEPAEVPQE